MCGILGAISQKNKDVATILVDGLLRLEYRGYDSAGLAVLKPESQIIQRVRKQGKVQELAEAIRVEPLSGNMGIAHTRWATHGVPSERNAHPHMSGNEIAIVHNGIIENHHSLREQLVAEGYLFASETDTEVVAHLIHKYLQQEPDILLAVRRAIADLEGAYALAIIYSKDPKRIIGVCHGCPLVIGLGTQENFLASDQLALLPITQNFIFLQKGDVVDLRDDQITIYNEQGEKIDRPTHFSQLTRDMAERGQYRHFMLKEIFEQPRAVKETLMTSLRRNPLAESNFSGSIPKDEGHTEELFAKVKRIQIVACGTSYHAGLVAAYWFESLAGIPCRTEIASEHRYRQTIVEPNTLFITLSQSGETADTLAALRQAKTLAYLTTLTICNVPESSLVRESEFNLMTHAGVEIGVASTKAFTTQLVALLKLTILLGKTHQLRADKISYLEQQLQELPTRLEQALELSSGIEQLARRFVDKQHALFLGRGANYPIAMEGALKLKEISYIHAEAYPAGELKHGPLALVDKNMPVIVVAPNDELLEKLKSNLEEVHARGGELIVFTDQSAKMKSTNGLTIITLSHVAKEVAPIIYTIPLQLLAYYVAVLKGTDVDQPRNLAKSVTVE
jgi:glucosamine--fructose-6-phosphate aminotransferase (isomerizing)